MVSILISLFCLFFVLLTISAYTDLQWGKVFNWLTFPAMVAGLVVNYLIGDVSGLGDDLTRNYNLLSSLFGLGMGLGILGIFFLAGAVGGGDVKLAGAIGALMGWYFLLHALLFASFVGGMMAVAVGIWHGRFWALLRSSLRFLVTFRASTSTESPDPLTIPYGVALVCGSFLAFFFLLNQSGFLPISLGEG